MRHSRHVSVRQNFYANFLLYVGESIQLDLTMYSVKPGRGPSFGGAIGGVVAAVFGVFWTVSASNMGAPGFFVLFGVVFVLMGLGGAAYHFYNATSENRFSEYDITVPGEEIDPLDPRNRKEDSSPEPQKFEEKPSFCPYCGTKLKAFYEFCPNCGKDI